MNHLRTIGIAIFMLIAAAANAQQVPLVEGIIIDNRGNTVGGGLRVQATNVDCQIIIDGTTEASGEYALTFVDFFSAIAEIGETISVTVRDASGTRILGSRSHQLTAADLRDQIVSIDIKIPAVDSFR